MNAPNLPTISISLPHKLTEEQSLQSCILSPIQIQLLENDMSTLAQQILGLEFDPSNPIRFAQEDASLKGQLDTLRNLIARSEDAVRVLQNSQR
jgi:hypothetical protein